jgi:hypothetical protein
MALPATAALEDDANWAVERATALPEVWALVAENSDGLVDAWRLMSVCRASRAGAREFLSTLPGLVVCGGYGEGGIEVSSDVWRLGLATLQWEPMPALVTAGSDHACCAVRGTLVVLGGETSADEDDPISSEVEILSSGAFVDLQPLSCGGISGAAAIAVEESDSAAGQVLVLGGADEDNVLSTVHLVDLATGACAPQPDLLHERMYQAAGRLPDGRIVCAGGYRDSSAEVWGPPDQGAADAAWTWKELPAMSAWRFGCCGCVMSDGRFAVLGGSSIGGSLSSCEALVIGDSEHWEPLPPM